MPRKAWVQLNRLRTGHGRFNANLHRMGLADNKNCVCGDIQSASHILYHCTVMAPPCSITNTTSEYLIIFTILPFRLNRIVLPPVSYVYTTEEEACKLFRSSFLRFKFSSTVNYVNA